jgi:WD40 repeat protein
LAALGLPWAVLAGAKAPASPPIVLSFQENPIFLGPHEHNIVSIAFSPDGKTVATGAADGRLRFWDAGPGRLRSIHADDATRSINHISYSPDGKQIAAVAGLFSPGKDAIIWDTTSGRIVREFEAEAADASSATDAAPFVYKGQPTNFRAGAAVAFSPDGRVLATAPDDVALRDTGSGAILARLKQPAKGVKAIAFSPDGKSLLTAADDKKVKRWSVPSGVLETTLDGPTQPLNAIAVSPDGKLIVATSTASRSLLDKTQIGYVWAWDRSVTRARKIEVGDVAVRDVAFVSPTKIVVAAGRDVLLVDLQGESSTRPRTVWSHSKDVLVVAVSPDCGMLASGGADRAVDLVKISTSKLVHRLPGLVDHISSVATSSDGNRFATATIDARFLHHLPANESPFAVRYKAYFSNDSNVDRIQPSEVRIWSAQDGRLESMLPVAKSQVTAIKFIPQTGHLAVAGWMPQKGGMLGIWDAEGGKQLCDLSGQKAEVLSIAVSPDGRTLASGDADGNLDLWDVQSGTKSRSLKQNHPVEALAFSADGKVLAAGDSNRTVRLFDASSVSVIRTLKSRGYIESLDFSPDSNLLAAGTREPGLELWDLRAGTASRSLMAAGDYVESTAGFVAFSPDGRFVVCTGHGKDIAVFEVATSKLHCELRGHWHPAMSAAFLPDGKLISGGSERTVRLWDANHNKLLATWIAMPADAKQNWSDEWIGFRPSGEFVGSADLKRLVGWQTGGEVVGPQDATRRRVETLFPAAVDVPAAPR